MTNTQLIEQLKKFPKDTPVMLEHWYGGYMDAGPIKYQPVIIDPGDRGQGGYHMDGEEWQVKDGDTVADAIIIPQEMRRS